MSGAAFRPEGAPDLDLAVDLADAVGGVDAVADADLFAGGDMTEKQRRILRAALDVFSEKGFAGAPTAEIAKRAQVAEGTIFKHYKTKKELFLGVVGPLLTKAVVPRMATPVQEILNRPWTDIEALLRAIIEERVGFVRSHPRLVRIVAQEVSLHPEVRGLLADALRPVIFDRAVQLITRLQEQGALRRDLDVLTILRLTAGTIMSYSFTRIVLFPERAWDDAKEIDAMVSVLARGLRP